MLNKFSYRAGMKTIYFIRDQCIIIKLASYIGMSASNGFTNDESYEQFIAETLTSGVFRLYAIPLSLLYDMIRGLEYTSAGHDDVPLPMYHTNIEVFGDFTPRKCYRS